MPENLFEQVSHRFTTYAEGGRSDDSLILSKDASKEAEQLWRAAVEDSANGWPGVRIVQALAWLHYARHMASPAGEDADDLQASVICFVPVFVTAPDQLPDRVTEFFSSGIPFDMVMDDSRHPAFQPESFVQRRYPKAYENAEHAWKKR